MGIKQNVGRKDRLVRAVLAVWLLYLASYFPDIAEDPLSSTILFLVGASFLAVAAVGHCPVYRLIDLDTLNTHNDNNGI